jgi:hypothetical protein
VTHDLWEKASYMLKDYFSGMTLQDLLRMDKKKNPKAHKV